MILVSGSLGALAQVSAPLPSTAQVISQSVESVSGGSMQWEMGLAEVPAMDTDPLISTDQFLYADQGQIVVSHESGERELISASQAAYTSGSWEANSTTSDVAGVRTISLITAAPADGIARSQPFDVEAGDYNLQLTRGVLPSGQADTFETVNDYPIYVIVTSGAVNLSAPGGADAIDLGAGDVSEWSGEAAIASDGDATYLITSIGEKLPPVEVAVAPRGEVLVLFWDCAESDFPVQTREQCELVWEPISASFTMFSQGTPLTRTDATQLPDGSWIYEEMTAGEWEFQLFMPDGSAPPTYTVLGDAEERDGQWVVTVQPGERSVANVMMYGRVEASALTITFMECPDGWDPSMEMTDCWFAANEPNMRIEGVTGQDVMLNTQVDAIMPSIGTYEFQELSAGTYLITLEYNETWTPESTYFLDAASTIHPGTWTLWKVRQPG